MTETTTAQFVEGDRVGWDFTRPGYGPDNTGLVVEVPGDGTILVHPDNHGPFVRLDADAATLLALAGGAR